MKSSWRQESQSLLAKQCVKYFQEYKIFQKLFQGFRKKYDSYGSFSGAVTLRNLSEEDLEILEGFFQKNFHGKKSISITARQFEDALKKSRFEEVSPKEVLECYFHEKMTGKKERKIEEEELFLCVLAETEDSCQGTPAKEWLDEIRKKGEMYSYVYKRFREENKDPEKLKEILLLGCKILCEFPYHRDSVEYLAVFAAKITGNPHAFDDGEKEAGFLKLLIQWDILRRGVLIEKQNISPALQRQKTYLKVGILRDDMSNYAMLYGVRAWKKDGKCHEGMDGFCKMGNPLHVPLSVIAGWKRVECPGKELYIVENPSVFALLCGKGEKNRAYMCMNGQPRLSAMLLLDLLAEAGVRIYYAGDFDPEGLLIAQKVKSYYQGEVVFWNMSLETYEMSKSSEVISEKRLKILERLEEPELLLIADAIRRCRLAGYQENIWNLW